MDQRELTIKAAYLFRLSLFVVWPPANLDLKGSEPIIFCVADDSNISASLKSVLAGKLINQHRITVMTAGLSDDLSSCHLLYLPEGVQTPQPFLQAAARYPVLTVGETETFYRHGGMVLLFKKNNTVRFAINQQVAEETGLKLKAQLLHLADQQP